MKRKGPVQFKTATKKDPTLNEAYKLFRNDKQANMRAKDTLEYYDKCYEKLLKIVDGETRCSEVTEDIIIDLKNYLRKDPNIKSPVSIDTNLRGVRALFYYCMKKGYMEDFPVTLINAKKPLKDPYTPSELQTLLVKPDLHVCTFAEYRNWVMVCFFCATGVRSGTIRYIKIADLLFEINRIRLTTVKNKEPYRIPMNEDLKAILLEYLTIRGGEQDDYLFCTIYKEQLSEDSIVQAIRDYNKSRGVEKTSIHLFRHAFAKNWIVTNGNESALQKVLGHKTPAMVKEYVNLYEEDIAENFDSHTPLTTMMPKKKEGIKMKKLTREKNK